MASEKFIICRTAPKLKHTALREIYSQLLNTLLIFTYNSWNKCCCHEFQGCRLKPLHRRLSGERNYCFICRVRTTYNIDKIYKLKRITEKFNTYRQMKEDLQLCIDFGCNNFWLYDYKTNGKRKFGETYGRCLKNFINSGYYDVCYYNL